MTRIDIVWRAAYAETRPHIARRALSYH